MRKILIATPAAGSQISLETCTSVTLAIKEGADNGWEVRWLPLPGSADVAKIRNYYLGYALKSSIDDLLYVDADVSWGPGTFPYLMNHKVDFVLGAYRERSDARVKYPVIWPKQREFKLFDGKALLKGDRGPAGFLRVTKSCIEKMSEASDVNWIKSEDWEIGMEYPFLFEWTWERREDDGVMERNSEDYTFCRRWQKVGGTVWVDPAIKLNHTGPKAFEGDLMAHLQGQVSSFDAMDSARAALAMVGVAA